MGPQFRADTDKIIALVPEIFAGRTRMPLFDFYRGLGDRLREEMTEERFNSATGYLEKIGLSYERDGMEAVFKEEVYRP